MNMTKLLQNMEGYVQSFRKELDKHEGSGMNALADNAKTALTNLKAMVLDSSTAQSALENMRGYVEKFEDAVKKGDKQLSAKALHLMEEALKELRKRQGGKDETDK